MNNGSVRNEPMSAGLGCILIIIGIPLVLVVVSILNGYVLSILWGWFIVPTFEAPELSVVAAIGISLVVSYLTHQENEYKKEKDGLSAEKVVSAIATVTAKPLVVLLFGWILNFFM